MATLTDTSAQHKVRLRKDKLAVSVYANHGDTCSLAPHCKSLGCASGFDSTDYVLAASFAYLQEAIDYAEYASKAGVRVRLVSRIVASAPFVSDYPKVTAQRVEYVPDSAVRS